MNRLKGINNIADFKELLLLHKESIKKAALPVTVMAALLIFWISGANEDNKIEEVNNMPNDVAIEQSSEGLGLETQNSTNTKMFIYVDIGGCVYNPGVYKIEAGTRLFQVIEKAGGLTDAADLDSINQAEEVYDGQKILIYAKSTEDDLVAGSSAYAQNSNGKININRADASQLQEIPGVGPVTSQSIIDYRESVGKFKSIEDIKNVSGIGEKTFEKLKEHITV